MAWRRLLLLPLLLSGCQIERKDEKATVTVTQEETTSLTRPASSGSGRVIDQAGALDPTDMEALASDLAGLEQAGGPRVTLIMLRPTAGESMEQIGWAVTGQAVGKGVTLLVDADQAAVRIEGVLPPERKAAVASAMRADLVARRYPEAARAALAVLRT